MNELGHKSKHYLGHRWALLTGTSVLALMGYIGSNSIACADEGGKPQVWIELGGQVSQLGNSQESFAPSIMEGRPSNFDPSQEFEGPPSRSIDEIGAVSIEPSGTNWSFSASLHYGRSASNGQNHQQDDPVTKFPTGSGDYAEIDNAPARFADTSSRNSQDHLVLDFQAGKDVGLGLFGGTSLFSVGVRIAQFHSSTNIVVRSDPDWAFKYASGFNLPIGWNYHVNSATLHATRSFNGIGPSLAWAASAPLSGNQRDGQILFDWGVNAALLFGRQKTRTHHQTTGRYHYWKYSTGSRPITYQGPAQPDHIRTRSVTIPNVGGFAGLSFRYINAKISLGYRADFFFGAMDGGIDTRKTYDRNFYGPYAAVSIGLGG